MKTVFIDIANAPEKSDESLYTSYLNTQDRSVITILYRKYMSLVFGVCMKYLKEKQAAQDSAMEVFERLLTHQPSSEIRHFKSYLYVITKNHCLMKLRGEKMIEIEISAQEMENALYVHPLDDEHDTAVEAALQKCLNKLKDMQRLCVELFYLKKKSYLEVAYDLKIGLSEVKSSIQNGKRNLKLCIEGTNEA